jgi:hypothetical protein
MINRQTHRKAYDRWLTKRAETNKRNISFEITFSEWYYWWLENGVDKNIDSAHDLCMCRNNDTGPYRLDNIYFATRSQNVKDSLKWNPRDFNGEKNPNYGNRGEKNPLSRNYNPQKKITSLHDLKEKEICR